MKAKTYIVLNTDEQARVYEHKKSYLFKVMTLLILAVFQVVITTVNYKSTVGPNCGNYKRM